MTNNGNLSKRGVEQVVLEVYRWFDDYENLDIDKTLCSSQVTDLTNQGKVAKSHSNPTERQIICQDLVKSSYFSQGTSRMA